MGPSTRSFAEPNEAAGFAARWKLMHEAGQEIGQFAALAREPLEGELAVFPEAIEAAGEARKVLASETISDIDAMVQPGLAALRAIHARGQDTTAPALALWREYHAARSALLALAASAPIAQEPVAA